MNLKQTIIKIEQQLQQADISNARLDAEILVSYVLKKSREFLFSYPELALSSQQVARLLRLVKARIKGTPLAYLVKTKSFYKHDFLVTNKVLIPRPESELIIDAVLKKISNSEKNILLVDVGTGSGCIILSLANELRIKSNFKFYGSDSSYAALKVAKTNAKTLNLAEQINWVRSSLLKFWFKKSSLNLLAKYQWIIIVANLPYLSEKFWQQDLKDRQILELKQEPAQALFAGLDGFDIYRQLAKELVALKKLLPDKHFELYAEINPSQTELFKDSFGYLKQLIIKKDLNQNARLVIAE